VTDHHGLPVDPEAGDGRRRWAGIAVGGAVGTSARYGLGVAFPVTATGFPWTTFSINLVGSFLLGALVVVVIERRPEWAHWRLPLGTGVLGGFTTMSTLAVEADQLARDGHGSTAVLYVAAGVLAALAGMRVAER
jgi:CrcB protein